MNEERIREIVRQEVERVMTGPKAAEVTAAIEFLNKLAGMAQIEEEPLSKTGILEITNHFNK